MAEVPMENIIEGLELMKDYRYNDKYIDSWIWDSFIEYIEQCFDTFEDYQKGLLYLIDNFFVNGSYGSFDDFKKSDESTNSFIKRAQDNGWMVNTAKKLVIESFGI